MLTHALQIVIKIKMKEGTEWRDIKFQTLNILFSIEDYKEKWVKEIQQCAFYLRPFFLKRRQLQQVFPFNEAMNIILLQPFTLVLFQTCIYGPVNTRAFLPFYLFGRSTVERLARLFQPACLLTIFHPIMNGRDCGGGSGVDANHSIIELILLPSWKKKNSQKLNMILKWQFIKGTNMLV